MGKPGRSADLLWRALRRVTIILTVLVLLVGSWETRQRAGYQVVDATVVTERSVPREYFGESREVGVRYGWQASHYMVFVPAGALDALTGLGKLAETDSVQVALNPQEPHQVIFNRLSQRYPVTLVTSGLLLLALLGLGALAWRRRSRR